MVTMEKRLELLVILKTVELKHLSMFYNYKYVQLKTFEDGSKLVKDLHQVSVFECRFLYRKKKGNKHLKN